MKLLGTLASLLPLLSAPLAPARAQAAPSSAPQSRAEVVRVIDGDTLEVRRAGRLETLRLLAVDTEEKIAGRPLSSPSKPETVFGEETCLWARDLFAGLARDGRPAEVGLLFPGDVERRDAYGRLLAHVILPDGRDFCLLLVELGKSPYFTKYGYDELRHADFVRAERAARAAQVGIWDPATNRARTPGAPEVRRPYEKLLPWWDARARAVEAFRADARREPTRVIGAEDAAALEGALAAGAEGSAPELEVFGEVERFFDERDGSRTVLFRALERERALRAVLPAAERGGALEAWLSSSTEEFRQNYLRVRGTLERGPRGIVLRPSGPAAWRLAGPEPAPERDG